MFRPQPKPTKQEKAKKKFIKPISDSKRAANDLYSYLAKKFKLSHRICIICKQRPTIDIHHKLGRQGYADEWAEKMDVTLLLDIRYWLPVCRECHNKIEGSPEWAKENGYTINRTIKK